MRLARNQLTQKMRVELPGSPQPDGDGGYTETWTAAPDWWCAVMTGAHNDERVLAEGITASVTHVLRGDFRPDITTLARLWWFDSDRQHDRRLDVLSADPVNGERFSMVVSASEYVDTPRPLTVARTS